MGSIAATIAAKQSEAAAKEQLQKAAAARRDAVVEERTKTMKPFIDEFNNLRYKLKSLVTLDSYCTLNRLSANNALPPELRAYLMWDFSYTPGCGKCLYVIYNSSEAILGEAPAESAATYKGWPAYMTADQTEALLRKVSLALRSGCFISNRFAKRLITLEPDGRFKHWEDYRKLEPTFLVSEAVEWIADELYRHMELLPDPHVVESGDAMLASGKGRRKRS